MPSGFLFDLDGTLLNSDPLHMAIFADMLRPAGVEVDHAFYTSRILGRNSAEIFAELLPGCDAVAMDDEKEARFRDVLDRTTIAPTPGTERLLDRIAAAGLPVAVATNAPRQNAEAMLRAVGLRDRFPVVVAAEEVARGKPYPDVYLDAAAKAGADPARAIAFEDSGAGVTAAAAAGCTVIGLTTSLSPDALCAAGARHAIRDYEDPGLFPLLGLETGALS